MLSRLETRIGLTCVMVLALAMSSGCDLFPDTDTGDACGGLLGALCDRGEFCYYETGICGEGDQTGVCTALPETCTLTYAPVCGCDGVTYTNECLAWTAGASVQHEGECEVETCWTDEDCGSNAFCLLDTCEAETGACTDIPEACTEEEAPVCGCDEVTYSNECQAWAAGVSVLSEGECVTDSCWTNEDCNSNAYCDFDVCEAETGVCEDKPEVCTEEYAPVCGCDGETYGNECFAAMAGVTVAESGICDRENCGSNADCGEASYCMFDDCEIETGSCQEQPEACTEEYSPVCGCDGETYGNACSAAAAGVSVDYEGECS